MPAAIKSSVARLLWQKHYDLALCSLSHPFVVSLQRNQLQSEAFRVYIAQDAYYLNSFSNAFGSAKVLCANKNDSGGEESFATLQRNVQAELQMHEELSRSLGIDLTQTRPMPSTQLYVDFLDQTAGSLSVASICAAMVPCMSLYAFIGRRAVENRMCDDATANRWVQEYSSDGFQSYAQHLEGLLDTYSSEEAQSTETLSPLYARAMELEYAFFNAFEFKAWTGVHPRLIGIDFDETLSLEDSIALMCGVRRDGDCTQLYARLLQEYLESYHRFIASHLPAAPVPFDRAVIDTFLTKLTEFEMDMRTPVQESGILRGLTPAVLRALGSGIALRIHADKVIAYAGKWRCPIHVVTLNWSRDLVAGALQVHSSDLRVHSNDLTFDAAELSSGGITGPLCGPLDKATLLREIKAGSQSTKGPVVFVGDSLGDLSGLLDSDIGIVIGGKSSMRSHCERFGIELRHLEWLPIDIAEGAMCGVDKRKSHHRVLYTADSWVHIGIALFGKTFVSEFIASLQLQTINSSAGQRLPTVLSVAGSDSGGGAGIQADIKTCAAHGVFAATAVTALTAQNTVGVTGVDVTAADMLARQLDAVLSDLRVDAVKSGMIPTEESARLLAKAVVQYSVAAVVVDPVMVTSSGSRLMPAQEAEGIRRMLFPMATVVTPNIHEACALLGIASITTIVEMEAAAKSLYELGPAYVLVKGGHMIEGQSEGKVVDVLYDGAGFEHIEGDYVASSNTHGTGCTLASAIAASLAKGLSVPDAVRAARQYLAGIMRLSKGLTDMGRGPHGPLDHMALLLAAPRHVSARNAIDLSVYVVTDSGINARRGRSIEEAVAAAVAGGATVVQLREKSLSSADFYSMAKRVKAITTKARVPLIINDRIDIALAVSAEGVHLGQGDIPAAVARRMVGPNMILGVSAKTPKQALQAETDGADYIGVGAVYGTSTKSDAEDIGLEGLARVRAVVDLPIVAIGGITLGDSARAVISVGAQGAAVVSAVFDTEDVEVATRTLAVSIAAAKAMSNGRR